MTVKSLEGCSGSMPLYSYRKEGKQRKISSRMSCVRGNEESIPQ